MTGRRVNYIAFGDNPFTFAVLTSLALAPTSTICHYLLRNLLLAFVWAGQKMYIHIMIIYVWHLKFYFLFSIIYKYKILEYS